MSQTPKPKNVHDYTRWRKNKQYRVIIDYVPGYMSKHPGSFNTPMGDYFQYKILHDGEIQQDGVWPNHYFNAMKVEIEQWLQING